MMREFLSITKALSDESRVRVLMALSHGELCVCQIIELLGLAPSTVSKHMSILKQARLIESSKSGKWVYYSLPKKATQAVSEAVEWAKAHLLSDMTIREDAKALRAIVKRHPVEVCKKQRQTRVAVAAEVRTASLRARS